ncbi:MAG: hypothetical protein AAF280_13775 [Pseudomonadota bacterium]
MRHVTLFIFFILSLLIYFGAIVLAKTLLSNGIDNEPLRILIALLPMLPAVGACTVGVFAIRSLDEMQRRLQFEALALAFVGTAFITFSYGFLEGIGFSRLSMFVVWPIMGTLWFIGVMIGRVRFG